VPCTPTALRNRVWALDGYPYLALLFAWYWYSDPTRPQLSPTTRLVLIQRDVPYSPAYYIIIIAYHHCLPGLLTWVACIDMATQHLLSHPLRLTSFTSWSLVSMPTELHPTHSNLRPYSPTLSSNSWSLVFWFVCIDTANVLHTLNLCVCNDSPDLYVTQINWRMDYTKIYDN
jgi:hypothetical protein